MPWAAAIRPSIQCGLLKAVLERQGHTVDVLYLNAELAAQMGADNYNWLAEKRQNDLLLGEWLFSVAAFAEDAPADITAFSDETRGLDRTFNELGFDLDKLVLLRSSVLPKLIDHWAESIDWSDYAAVGFTSTFEQTVAGLALADRIKRRHPQVKTMFGGANFDGAMGAELVKKFEQIDYAVVGEGDRAIVSLVQAIGWGDNPLGIEGVIGRHGDLLVTDGRAPSTDDMDDLPIPDYDDYFATLDRLGRDKVIGDYEITLPIESARGCWWGQKHHCTFCGLNGDTMTYRSKTPAVVADQLRKLSGRYNVLRFEAVDNIMDVRYVPNMLAPLAQEPWDYSIFYEVRANLRRDQLALMARAGITSLQPGIESLSTNVLRLMRKGTTVLHNVRMLKWAGYYNIRVGWNMIMGFPGETIEDYETQFELIPKLYHLQPPSGAGPIWLERFSPYFNDPELGLENRGPKPAYRHVWPKDVDLDQIAYFFESGWDGALPDSLYRHMSGTVEMWKERWATPNRRPILLYERAPDWLHIVDSREPDAAPKDHDLDHDQALIYEACGDREKSAAQVAEELADKGIGDDEKIRVVLEEFCDRDLMIRENGKFLSLALPIRRD